MMVSLKSSSNVAILRAVTKCGFNLLTSMDKGSSYCDLDFQRNVDAQGWCPSNKTAQL